MIIDCHCDVRDIFGDSFQFEGRRTTRRCRPAWCSSPQSYVYLLALYLSRVQSVGPGKRQWPAISLEGGVAPIALILHFKDLAAEDYLGVDSIYRMTKAGNFAGNLVR